jgi:hypothetical protein
VSSLFNCLHTLSGWFKSKKNPTLCHGKSDCLANRSYSSRSNSIHTKLDISKLIRNFSKLQKHSNRIASNNSISNRAHLFFIGRHLATKEKREEKLKEHYDKLSGVVLEWLDHTAEADVKKNGFPQSSVSLYINIAETIRKPIHYSRIKDHFGHLDYKEINHNIDDILVREPKHNEKVAKFVNTLEQRVSQQLEDRSAPAGAGCVVALEHIVQYFWNKSSTLPDTEIGIGLADERTKTFRVYRKDYGIELARGDEESMKCFLDKLKTLESEIVNELNELSKEANELEQIFNNDLKSRARIILADIEDGYLLGECISERRILQQKINQVRVFFKRS